MAEAGVISTLLPATAFCLKEEYAPARKMIDSGCAVALASDLNPGSCFTNSIPLLIALGCIYMNMSIEEVIHRPDYQRSGCRRTRRHHRKHRGGQAGRYPDYEIPFYRLPAYHTAVNQVETVIKKGEIIVSKRW